MKTSYKCIECFLRQIETASFLVKLKEEQKKEIQFLLARKLLQFDFNQPPVVFGRIIYKSVSKISGIKDIFRKEKIRIENRLIKFTPYFRAIIKESKDHLYAAAKICCAANAIDFGAGEYPNLKNLLSRIKRISLEVDHFPVFRDRLKKAKNLLVIGDNCGEVLFDKFFMEEILKFRPQIKIFYATRSSPIINDVVIQDAKRVGVDRVAKVISTGCDYPGVVLTNTSKYFRKIYKQTNLIISKGQGNFESISDKRKDIFYLFKIKCTTVSEFLSLAVNSLLFIHNKIV